MDKKKVIIFIIVSCFIYLGYSNIRLMSENENKQQSINAICRNVLYDVVIGYNYDEMQEDERKAYQINDITNLKIAGDMIQNTSWTLKERIQGAVILLYQYLNVIYQNSEFIEESKANKIVDYYGGIYSNIDNSYCEEYIDKLSVLLKTELKNYQ